MSTSVHLDAEPAGGRGNLHSDEPGADDCEPASRLELPSEQLRVLGVSEDMDARRMRERQSPGTRTGREHHRIPLEPARRPPHRVDGLDPASEDELDVPIGPVVVLSEKNPVSGPRQEILGKARSFIGSAAFLAYEDHPPVEAERAERLGAARAGETGADDDDRFWSHAACSPVARSKKTAMAAIGQAKAASMTSGSSEVPTRASAIPSEAS
jgi:hypothetical protein